jgi:hypothetical protein
VELKARSQEYVTTKVTGHDRSSYQVMVTDHVASEEQIKAKDNRQNQAINRRTQASRKDIPRTPQKELLREHGDLLRAFEIVRT